MAPDVCCFNGQIRVDGWSDTTNTVQMPNILPQTYKNIHDESGQGIKDGEDNGGWKTGGLAWGERGAVKRSTKTLWWNNTKSTGTSFLLRATERAR